MEASRIVLFSTVANGGEDYRIVLREVGGSFPYVSHYENVNKNVPDFYWGHYYKDAEEGAAGFFARVKADPKVGLPAFGDR